MAEETVDAAIKACNLTQRNGCLTPGLLLEGAHNWDPLLYIHLVQDYGIEVDVSYFYFLFFKFFYRWLNIFLILMVIEHLLLLVCAE